MRGKIVAGFGLMTVVVPILRAQLWWRLRLPATAVVMVKVFAANPTMKRYNRCSLPGRGRAQLVRQISNSACIEGRSWGSDYGSVWVNDGCRGDFSVMRGNSGWNGGGWGDSGTGGRVFRCESNDGRYNECAANTRAGVQLIRQLSNSPCIEGRSWGYGRSGIWVAQGRRAEFRSY